MYRLAVRQFQKKFVEVPLKKAMADDNVLVKQICNLMQKYYESKGVEYEEGKFEEWIEEQV